MRIKFYISVFCTILLFPFWMMAQGLIIPPGGYVIAVNGNIVLTGNWINNGSFTHNGGALVFAGTTQSISGSTATTFNNITTLTGSNTTVVSPAQKLKGVLLSNGTLNANGNLTLLSNATATAAVDGSGTGEVLGNLIIQRYVISAFGYKYISPPFQYDTVGDLANDLNLAAAFPTFYRYDENLASNGWLAYTGNAGVLNPMQGYAANLGVSGIPKTIDMAGVVNNHEVSTTLYNHNKTYTLGFNLVGNPYPSPVNWDAAGGWTKTNIDNAVYYFNAGTTNQYTGVYSSYINGISSDGVAGSTIPAMQGFFVHVSNGSFPVTGQLIVNNGARVLNPAINFYRTGGIQDNQPLLRLSAGFADETGFADPLTFYFSENATARFNKTVDALKLMNTDSVMPNLFALSADAQQLSIQALQNNPDTITTVPLGLITKKAGWISFHAKDMKALPVTVHAYFFDKVTGINQDLQKEPVYRLFLASGNYENRFFLQFSRKEPIAPTNTNPYDELLTIYSAGGRLFVKAVLPAGESGHITVMNTAGQTLCRQAISGNVNQPVNALFSAGLYIVHFTGSGKSVSKKVFIGYR